MGKSKSDESDNVEGSECKEEEFAARFLLRALEELRLADDTITVEDLHTFAGTLIKEMGLMIGSEKSLRGRFDVIDQINLFYPNVHHQIADQLREKIIQAQQNLAKTDREFPL